MITPTKKRLAQEEVAMLLAEKGLDQIPDVKSLLENRLTYIGSMTTFKKVFSNYGTMIAILERAHPDLMALAVKKEETPVPPKPKAKPAPKAVKKEK